MNWIKSHRVVSWELGILVVFGILGALDNSQSSLTPAAQTNTFHNSFLSGCEQTDSNGPGESPAYCNCAYNALVAQDSHFADADKVNAILTNGYSQAQTDAIVNSCLAVN